MDINETWKLVIVFVVCQIACSCGESYIDGRCPDIRPQIDFNMTKFLGKWYAMEKSISSSPCITYEFKVGELPNFYEVEQISRISPDEKKYHYIGDILAQKSDPSIMRIIFPFSMKSSKFIVFYTDYESYAGVFICQQFKLFHRLSIVILSRTPSLNLIHHKRIYRFMLENSLSLKDLDMIDHWSCQGTRSTTDGSVDLHPEVDNGVLPSATTPTTEIVDKDILKPIIPIGSPRRRTTTAKPFVRDTETLEDIDSAVVVDASVSKERTTEVTHDDDDEVDPDNWVVLLFS